jgi:hypothetical protein
VTQDPENLEVATGDISSAELSGGDSDEPVVTQLSRNGVLIDAHATLEDVLGFVRHAMCPAPVKVEPDGCSDAGVPEKSVELP